MTYISDWREAEERAFKIGFEKKLALVLPHATTAESSDHGVEHWRRVARNGAILAPLTPGADAKVVAWFAVLHDSQRENEFSDPDHGERAADLARKLDLGLTDDQQWKLVQALISHDRGQVSGDPTIGVCWDADRLDLPRVGITPDPKFFSTKAGRSRVSIR